MVDIDPKLLELLKPAITKENFYKLFIALAYIADLGICIGEIGTDELLYLDICKNISNDSEIWDLIVKEVDKIKL